MTPQESILLQSLGTSLLADFTAFAAVSILHGVFTTLFAISTSIIVRRGFKTRASWAMLTVTVTTFIISTMYWASDLAIIVCHIKYALIENPDLQLAARPLVVRGKTKVASGISLLTSVLPPIISDGVVIWRAWVLFPDRRWVMIFPLSLLLGTIASTLTYVSLRLIGNKPPKVNGSLYGSTIILSMSTNVITTLLVAFKLWRHRKYIIKDLGMSHRQSPVQKVLNILVESGFIYCALQAVTLTLDSLPNASMINSIKAYTIQVFLCSYTVISAMYPTVVIILVNTQRSFLGKYGFANDKGLLGDSRYDDGSQPATSGHLSFASVPTRASFSAAIIKGDSESTVNRENNSGFRMTTFSVVERDAF